jgi:alkaline phosphatase
MDGALDRKILKGGTVGKFPQQPDLTEQVSAALKVLARSEAGFFLMVESGMIDKYTHLLDMERGLRHHHARQRGEAHPRLGERSG